jgi:hypothetical protein
MLAIMTDWDARARLEYPDLPAAKLSSIVASLRALDLAFRPLLGQLLHDIEPAIILSEPAVSGE